MAVLLGKGTSVSTNLSGTMTPIPAVESVSIGEVTTDVEELELLSDTQSYPAKIPVKTTYGDITITVIYDPAVHSILDSAAQTLKSPGQTFRVQVGDFGEWECVGVVAGDVTLEKSRIVKRQYRFIVVGPHSSS